VSVYRSIDSRNAQIGRSITRELLEILKDLGAVSAVTAVPTHEVDARRATSAPKNRKNLATKLDSLQYSGLVRRGPNSTGRDCSFAAGGNRTHTWFITARGLREIANLAAAAA